MFSDAMSSICVFCRSSSSAMAAAISESAIVLKGKLSNMKMVLSAFRRARRNFLLAADHGKCGMWKAKTRGHYAEAVEKDVPQRRLFPCRKASFYPVKTGRWHPVEPAAQAPGRQPSPPACSLNGGECEASSGLVPRPALHSFTYCRGGRSSAARGDQLTAIGGGGLSAPQALDRQLLHQAAGLHHRDPAAEMGDHGQIVADQQVGEATFLPQAGQEVQDFRLHRDVQCGGRFVEQQHPWFEDERPGDGDALSLATRKLVGKAEAEGGIQSDCLQHPFDPLSAIPEAVHDERLTQGRVDGKARMQRAIGILKDHLQLAEEVPTGAPGQGGAGDGHPSLPFPLQRAEYPQHRRLAAAGFPYQPEAFAFAHVKADILDSVHGVGALAEMDVEPFNLDHSGTSTPKR